MMLAKLSPWSIVYPTLVDVNAYEEEPSEELQHVVGCLVMEMSFIYLFDFFVFLNFSNISNKKVFTPVKSDITLFQTLALFIFQIHFLLQPFQIQPSLANLFDTGSLPSVCPGSSD